MTNAFVTDPFYLFTDPYKNPLNHMNKDRAELEARILFLETENENLKKKNEAFKNVIRDLLFLLHEEYNDD